MVFPIQLPNDAPFTAEQRAWLNDFLAKALFKTLKKGNFEPEIHDMAAYDRSRLTAERNLLIITSTYGDGEPPDTATELHSWLMSDAAPRLDGISYSVL